jgi:hypothetical protein
MSIFEKTRELGLPENDFVVVGGGVLTALGLAKWDNDIDMAVTPEIFESFKDQNWERYEREGKELLRNDIYDVGVDFGQWNLNDLKQDAFQLEGISFMSLQKLLEWKREASREKDHEHIRIIEAYMKHHND